MGGNNFTIKIPLVNQYKNLLDIEKENFDSVTYNTFLSSYLNSCGDPYISALASDLNEIYSNIEVAYNSIDTWWNEYNQNISGLENSLASKTLSSSLTEGSVISFISSNMCNFSIYDKEIEPLINNNYNTILLSESVISSVKEVSSYDLTGSTLGNNTYNVSLNGAIEWINNTSIEINNLYNRTFATIGTGLSSLIEGVGKFGEGLYDVYKIGQTAVRSIGTGLVDAGGYIYSQITGNNWDSLTKKIWENTKAEVSKEHVKSTFDKFYDNTNFGQILKEESVGFDTVRSIGNGIGYIGGAVALTALTCGAGTAVMTVGGGTGLAFGSTAATTAASGAATMTITSNALAAGGITAAAGIGKNTEAAWNDGATLKEGLAYGTAMGAWEGLEMTLGYGINSLKVFKCANTASQVGNSISHVLADTVDGATAGGIEPLMKMIYSPSDKNQDEIMSLINYNENGNKINDKTWDSLTFKEKYDALFKYNGGWDTVVNYGLGAGVFSLLSEVPDVAKVFKNAKVETRVDTQIPKVMDEEFEIKGIIDKIKKTDDLKTFVDEMDDVKLSKVVSNLSSEVNDLAIIYNMIGVSLKNKNLNRATLTFESVADSNINGFLQYVYNTDKNDVSFLVKNCVSPGNYKKILQNIENVDIINQLFITSGSNIKRKEFIKQLTDIQIEKLLSRQENKTYIVDVVSVLTDEQLLKLNDDLFVKILKVSDKSRMMNVVSHAKQLEALMNEFELSDEEFLNTFEKMIVNDDLVSFIKNLEIDKLSYLIDNMDGYMKHKIYANSELEIFYDPVIEKASFFFENTMMERFVNMFGKYIPPEIIKKKLKDSIHFYSHDRFMKNKNVTELTPGYNTKSTRSVINVSRAGDKGFLLYISHESLHELSRQNYITGLKTSDKLTKFNECVTEYLNVVANNGDSREMLQYEYGSAVIDQLITKRIITLDQLMDAYFSNSPDKLKTIIDNIYKEGTFDRMTELFVGITTPNNGDNNELVEASEKALDDIINKLEFLKTINDN